MTSTLDRLRRKKPASTRIPICMDPALVAEIHRIERDLGVARAKAAQARNDEELARQVAELDDALETAKEAARADSEWFLVEALAPGDFDDLVDAHPPTKDQKAQARKESGPKAVLPFNTDTFPDALVAACTSLITKDGEDPETGKPLERTEKLSEEFVKEMRASGQWNTGELMALFNAATLVNQSTSQVNAAGNG